MKFESWGGTILIHLNDKPLFSSIWDLVWLFLGTSGKKIKQCSPMGFSYRVSLVLELAEAVVNPLPWLPCLKLFLGNILGWRIKEGAFSRYSQLIFMSQYSLVPLRPPSAPLLLSCPCLKSLTHIYFLSSILLCYPSGILCHNLVLLRDPIA